MSVRLLAALAALSLLAGCTLRGPEVRVKAPEVVVDGQGTHCPPGQAKKGRC
ncbi:hypothetical protein [Gallaecimonas pentaromativorans]|uniref:Lipoprotein n=1 Tax=Gallaecimonas pentaromativorans TaxID=584787 RepID=A0A3N1NYT9_9GAMM|nr:hypothetical protein [Gallaecimonas pentaromativorans]MED5525775.1 hypothetical protein [Pseudomonadota bacterium]ROQ24994.1 hypothetical protein EDC28_106242 [Gallaecimonas pentaromativorans]